MSEETGGLWTTTASTRTNLTRAPQDPGCESASSASAAFFTTADFYCGRHIPDGFEVFRMVPGSCDTCEEPAPFHDESSTYCGRHLPAEVFYLTIPRPDCDTCGADAAAEYYSVGSGFQCRQHRYAGQGRTWWTPPEESDDVA